MFQEGGEIPMISLGEEYVLYDGNGMHVFLLDCARESLVMCIKVTNVVIYI